MQVFEIGGGIRVNLVVGFECAANLLLQFSADNWVTKEVVSDTAESRCGCFAPCRSVMGCQIEQR